MNEPEGSEKKKEDKDLDVEYVMQVDHQFADKVDDIVKSLSLSNFKVVADKKKRP